jgi:hypothetical protein
MPWGEAPTFVLTIPSDAGPGEARIVIGPELPPPLDTYLFGGLDLAVGGIIFYNGGTDDDYQFIVSVPAATLESIFIGSVVSGAVLDDGAGNPRGLEYAADLITLVTSWVMTASNVVINPGVQATVYNGDLLVVAERGDGATSMTPGTTVAAGYGDVPGPISVTIDKNYTDKASGGSRLKIHVEGQVRSTAVNTDIWIGVNITGVAGAGDRDLARAFCVTANQPYFYAGTFYLDDVGAGNVTATMRWKRVAGAGTATITANDSGFLAIAETP